MSEDKIYPSIVIRSQAEALELLEQENKRLQKQLDYIRNGEYLNQLRFERDMLQELVDNKEVSKEDKEFIDMTHRNTELLEQLQQSEEVIEEAKQILKHQIQILEDKDMFCNGESELLDILNKYKQRGE